MMAVIKSNYIDEPTWAEVIHLAKNNIQYIKHRAGQDKERMTRELFGFNGPIEKIQAYEMVDRARKGTKFYRISINPDPRREDKKKDLDLKKLTLEAMRALEKRLRIPFEFIAAIHADHKDRRHINLMAILPRRLNKQELNFFRRALTHEALEQRKELDSEAGLNWRKTKKLSRSLSRALQTRIRQTAPQRRLRAPFPHPQQATAGGIKITLRAAKKNNKTGP